MKKRVLFSLILVLLCSALLFTGCFRPMTWQEQYDLGVRYLNDGKYEEAILAFTAAIELDPQRPEAYASRAEAYVLTGNEIAARKDADKVIQLDPSFSWDDYPWVKPILPPAEPEEDTLPPTEAPTEPEPVTEPVQQPSAVSAQYDIRTVDRSWRNQNGDVLVSNLYQQVVLLEQTPQADSINALITVDMETFCSEDITDYFESEAEAEDYLRNGSMSYGALFSNAGASVTHNGNGIFSICIDTEWFMGGVFNANHYGMTFDLTTGQPMTLDQLLGTDPATAKEILDRKTLSYVYGTYSNELIIDPEEVLARYSLDAFDFYIQDGELILCFPTYTFASGAAGSTVIPTGISVV